jgi:hypothetical protein
MEVITWLLVEKDAPEEWKKRSRESFILTFSPSGIFEQDDTEVFRYHCHSKRRSTLYEKFQL